MPRPWYSGWVAVSTARTARHDRAAALELPTQQHPEAGDALAVDGDPGRRATERVLPVLPREERAYCSSGTQPTATPAAVEDRRLVGVAVLADLEVRQRRGPRGRRATRTPPPTTYSPPRRWRRPASPVPHCRRGGGTADETRTERPRRRSWSTITWSAVSTPVLLCGGSHSRPVPRRTDRDTRLRRRSPTTDRSVERRDPRERTDAGIRANGAEGRERKRPREQHHGIPAPSSKIATSVSGTVK